MSVYVSGLGLLCAVGWLSGGRLNPPLQRPLRAGSPCRRRRPCSAAFVTKTLAPLLPPNGRPYETFWSIIQFRYVAWGEAATPSQPRAACSQPGQ